MNAEQLKLEHPAVYQEVLAIGIAKAMEEDPSKRDLSLKAKAEAVLKAINDLKDQTFKDSKIEEFTKEVLKKIKQKSGPEAGFNLNTYSNFKS